MSRKLRRTLRLVRAAIIVQIHKAAKPKLFVTPFSIPKTGIFILFLSYSICNDSTYKLSGRGASGKNNEAFRKSHGGFGCSTVATGSH